MEDKLPADIGNIFYPSDKLRSIVKAHGWTFYEIDDSQGNEPGDLERRGPSKGYFKFGSGYLVVPIPAENESLEQAIERIMIQRTSVPALDINGQVVTFTRIEFGYAKARVMAPPPLSPGADIFYENDNLLNVFETGFFIQTPFRSRKTEPRWN